MEIEGILTRALLDTGAKVSVMDEHTIKGLGLDKRMVRTSGCVFGVGSIPVKVLGYVEVSANYLTRVRGPYEYRHSVDMSKASYWDDNSYSNTVIFHLIVNEG